MRAHLIGCRGLGRVLGAERLGVFACAFLLGLYRRVVPRRRAIRKEFHHPPLSCLSDILLRRLWFQYRQTDPSGVVWMLLGGAAASLQGSALNLLHGCRIPSSHTLEVRYYSYIYVSFWVFVCYGNLVILIM